MEIIEDLKKATQPSTEINWKYVLFSLFGIALGIIGNTIVRKQQEKEIIDTLTLEIQKIETKTDTPTAEDEKRIAVLKAQKNVVTELQAKRKIFKNSL